MWNILADENMRPYLQQIDEITLATKKMEAVVDALEGQLEEIGESAMVN